MNLNLDKNLLDLHGNPKDDLLCNILADILATSSTMRPAQTMAWAYDLVKTGQIEISKADAEFVKKLIKRNQNFIDLAKVQLLEEIEKLEGQEYSSPMPEDECEKIGRDMMRKINDLL